jgi:D-methionine transport system substrate-binding protein
VLAFALPAGLTADKQLLVEGKDSAYYNVPAVKAEMKDDPRVQKL